MTIENQSLNLVYLAIDRINETRSDLEKLVKSPDTPIIGNLDSMAMVNFLVALEEEIEEKLKRPLSLVDGFQMPVDKNPFNKVGTLANFIETLLE